MAGFHLAASFHGLGIAHGGSLPWLTGIHEYIRTIFNVYGDTLSHCDKPKCQLGKMAVR